MISLLPVKSDTDVDNVAELAAIIWNEYFPAIIGQSQVDYMLIKFQSSEAIKTQIISGYGYYLIHNGQGNIGYIGLVAEQGQSGMQISKFYILKDYRGQGIARQVLTQIIEISKKQGYIRLFLTVNKYNHHSITAYNKLGFHTIQDTITDIGNGFVMDDYVMEMVIAR
jgi:ribosomal protein S18 acetylase RimI-like enzyme